MSGLCQAIRVSRPNIEAWASQDSRFQGIEMLDDHFNVERGSHLEDFVQEWLLARAEASSGTNIMTQLSASLNAAVTLATRSSAWISRSSSAGAGHQSASGPASRNLVQGADLVTGADWRSTHTGGQDTSAGVNLASNLTEGSSGPSASRRRRLNSEPASTARVFCPVQGCPDGDPNTAQGWGSHQAMRNHLNDHVANRSWGSVPQSYLSEHRLVQCQVCSRLISSRFGNACPDCRPRLAAGRARLDSSQQLPAGFPAVEEIFGKRVQTKAGIPKEARRLWSQCLIHSLSRVVQQNNLQSWCELLMLAKCALRTTVRGRRGSGHDGTSETKALCRRWLEGQRLDLWRQGREPRRSRGRRARPSRETLQARVDELVSQQQFSKACSAVAEEPPVEVTPRVVARMQDKHPAACHPLDWTRLRPVSPAASPNLDQELVAKMVRSFLKGSAGGPSGLKPQHIKDAAIPGCEDELFRVLAVVLSMLARGDVPQEVRPFLCGASLVALPKEDGGLRPIAVGECLRRLVGKCLAHSASAQARERLEPLQVGVGTPGGAEAVIHVVRNWCSRHHADPNRVLLKVDVENAFNSVDRQAILEAVREFSAALVPWADFTYANDSTLILGHERVSSRRGVQQGDPLGPLFFSLALHRVIEAAKRRAASELNGNIDFTVFYLDDGVVAGESQAVAGFADILRQELAKIGLTMNVGKCEVVAVACENTAVQRSAFPRYKWIDSGGFTLLGAAIGSVEFCTAHSNARRAKAETLFDRLAELENPQVAYLLIRHCASFCRITYSTRVTPPNRHGPALQEFDSSVKRAFSASTGVILDSESWERAQLSTRLGGLGLRRSSRHADCAYVSSLASACALGPLIDNGFDPSSADFQTELAAPLASLNEKMPAGQAVEFAGRDTPSQRVLSESIDSAMMESWLLNPDQSVALRAHLRLICQEGAGAWLHAAPSRDKRTVLNGELFRVAIKRRLRMPLLEAPAICPCCGDTLDIYMDHALVCSCGGDRTLRHNALRNLVNYIAAMAGLRPEKEKAGLLPPRPDGEKLRGEQANSGGRRPADIWIPQWHAGGPAAWDFAVTSGLRSDLLFEAAEQPGTVVADYERHKRSYLNTARACDDQGLEFLPVVVEAHSGTWGPTARAVWRFLAKAWAATSGHDMSYVCSDLAQRTSTTLQRENARAVLRRMAWATPVSEEVSPEAWLDEDASSVASGD